MGRYFAALIVLIFIAVQICAETSSPQPGPVHGPFQGKKECYNYPPKKKNCDCHRVCSGGQPNKDPQCKNYCFEDKCKCRTNCQTMLHHWDKWYQKEEKTELARLQPAH